MRLFYACAVTPLGGGPGRTEGASEAATALCLGLVRSANRVQHYVGLPLPCIFLIPRRTEAEVFAKI